MIEAVSRRAMKKLLLIKTGDTLASIKEAAGDFDRMFLDKLGELAKDVEVIEAHKGGVLPSADSPTGVIVTGSPHSVTLRESWADRLARWLADRADLDRPLLGVCYGHQLLAHAIGADVALNPKGYEVGTISVELTEHGASDPLIGRVAGGKASVLFHSTHQDAVMDLPSRARVLASTEKTEVQAFAVGRRVWGVQFHPEFTATIMRLYIEGRSAVIERDAKSRGEDPSVAKKRAESSVRETEAGGELLRLFVEEIA
jgi:GMP synthase (glutamine-hydrolysing)